MKPRIPTLASIAAVCLTATALAVADARIEHWNSGAVFPEGLPFSEAVRVDDTIYLSGQIGVKPGTLELVEGGMAAEARQTLDNVKATLEANGFGMEHVAKCTVMLADIAEWGDFNEIYQSYFAPPYPARSAFGASGLAMGARLELECLAVAGKRRRAVEPVGAHSTDDEERVYKRPGAQ